MPMRSKRVPSIEDDSTLLPTESSLSNDAVSRLRVISERVAQYEQQRPLTLEVQRTACEKMHAQLEALMEGVLEDEMMHLILQLLLRVESLLTDLAASPAKSNTMTSCSSLGPPREHKLIDTRSMTKFNGNVLEYPNYRASLKYVLDLPGRSDGEKYQAIRQTLNDASKAFLAEIDPSNPDLQRALELLDNEYLSGRNVEDAIKCKVHRVKPVTAKSPIKDWLDYQTTVKHLLLFVNAGHLTSTAEKDIHKVLVKKLTEKDEEFAVFKGQTLKELAAVVEEFVNRARHYDREYKPSDRTPRREGERRPFGFPKHHSDPRHHYRPRVQTNTVVAAPCLFCRGQHDMKDCPMALKLKYQKLREHNRCFRCLEDRPRGHDCGRECKQCRRNHHETLCPQPHSSVSKPKETTEKGRNPPRTFTATVMNSACSPRYLPSMRLMVSAQPNHQLPARVLLDSGSTESYVSETFAKALGAHFEEGPPRHVLTFGGQAHFPVSRETRLQLQTDHHRAELSLSVMPPNVVAPIDVPTEEVIRLARRHGVKVSTSSSPVEEVDLLIGANDLNDYFAKENIRTVSLSGSLRAYDSRFGWYLQGSISNESNSGKPRTFLIIGSENQCLCQSLDKLLRDPLSSKNEGDLSTEQWMQSYMQQVIFDPTEKRWIVPLPWISDSRPHNNRSTVYHSTKSQLSRYNERGLREKYDAAIGLYEEGDYAERVDDNTPGAYYLPHHHVFKPGSTTEVRIVMNASFARKGERSLNDTLYKGFSEQNNLFSLLIRWRMNPYAMIADLQKAFLQIRVRPEDRPYLRYLWAPAGSDQLVTYQMKSLMFGSTSAPFCLYITLRKMFESAPEPEVKDMVKSFYMDDAFFLGKDAATVRRLIEIVKRVLTECSFPIHKWACPHWMIPEGFPEVEQKQTIKCLGMQWNLADDTIFFTEVDTTAKVITRREVARIFGRLFEPHGLLGPFHTYQKIFVRKVLLESKGWDTPLSEALSQEAQQHFASLRLVSHTILPRAIKVTDQYELLGFADASKEAYGAVIYVRNPSQSKMNVLVSKSRLVSEKRTIPQLELCAAVLLVELYSSIRKDLPDAQEVRFYTDSMITLDRIRKSPNKYDQYVSRRLAIIAKESTPEQWRFVPTDLNPADALSRGLSACELSEHLLWFDGPEYGSLEKAQPPTVRTLVVQSTSVVDPLRLDSKLLDMEYDKLIRFLTSYYRLMDQQVSLAHRENEGQEEKASLDQLATASAWRLYQRVAFPVEIKCLQSNQPFPRDSKLAKLNIFLDKRGVMRLNRRLEHAPLDYEARYPIIANDHPFVRGFLSRFHEKTMAHASVNSLYVQTRNMLYLPELYKILRNIARDCPKCQWLRGSPFNATPATLPADRVCNEAQYPFAHIGVDLFGPLESGSKKFYGMLFVCANTRAIHLELLPSRHTQSILRAFQRFIGRRGVPRVVRSDNEKGFRQVDPYLADLINRRLREGLEAEYKFTWKFQPAKSPFWGGFFERLVGVVKKTLANWPLTRRYTQEELTTILCEVEALVNSRPLTAATHDSSPLTPSHFLIGRSHTFIPPLRMDHERPVDAALLNYVSLSAERDALWNRLKREYLVSLRHFHRLDSTREPQVGELVLIVGPWKRETWDWGRIESLMRGPDGVARAATLLMPNGSHWERPVQSLIPLESNLKGGMCGADNGASSESQVTSSVEMPRSPDQESILKRTPPSTDESAPKMVYKRRSNRLAALPRKRYR